MNLQQVVELLEDSPSNLVGCMIGRAFAANPWHFSHADTLLYGKEEAPIRNRFQLLERYGEYVNEQEQKKWGPLRTRRSLCRAIQNIFAGETNSKRYRIALDQQIAGSAKHDPTNTTSLSTMILEAATKHQSDDVLYRMPLLNNPTITGSKKMIINNPSNQKIPMTPKTMIMTMIKVSLQNGRHDVKNKNDKTSPLLVNKKQFFNQQM